MSSKGRFLVLLPGAFGPTGGIEAYCRLLVRAFHEVAVERGGECECLLLVDSASQLDPRYLHRQIERPRCFSGSRSRFASRAIERAIRFRPDLIVLGHVNFLSLGMVTRAVRPITPQWCMVYGLEVWHRLALGKRAALRATDRILSISDYTRRELVQHNDLDPSRIGLLPCALDPFWADSFSKLASNGQTGCQQGPLILSVGRLAADERRKGFDQVIRALPAITREVPGARYAIIGDGGDRPRLEALARDLGVSAQVEFRGRVSAAELAQAYAECSLFALPSSQEGFGIVFLEAALFDKPSIGGAHGGIPEVIADGSTGRLVDHGDAEALARIAIEMLRDPASLQRMGTLARARLAERFEYPTLLDNLRNEVERTLGAR